MAAITGTSGGTSTGGAGGGDAAAQAAADEARRKAEEARRQAEEAARRAAEAQAKAEAARRSANPSEKAKAGQLQSEADRAQASADQKAQAAQTAMIAANAAAAKAGRASPYPNTVIPTAGSEDAFTSAGATDTTALGFTNESNPEDTQAQLDADEEYARMAGTEDGRAALTELGIDNGTELRAFSNRVASGDEEAIAAFQDATRGNEALATQLTDSLSALNPAAADAIAEAEQPDEYGVTEQDREDLHAIGLTDDQINEAGAALPHLLEAARASDPEEVLRHLTAAAEAAPGLVDAAWSAITSRPEVQEFFSSELGIDVTKLGTPSEAIPKAIALFDAIKSGDAAAITQAIADFASGVDATAFQGLLDKVGDFLPEGVRDFLSGLAGNENLSAALSALASDPNLPQLVQAITDGDVNTILTTLAANPAFLTAAGKAIAEIPAVKALFEKLGLDPAQVESLQTLLTAIANDPNLPQITEALLNGSAEDALALLAQNPDVLTALGDAVADLPAVKALAEELGIDLSLLPDLGEALPDLLALKDAVEAGDVSAIAEGLVKVGQLLGSDAFSGMWAKLADQLPPAVAEFFGGLIGNENLQTALQALASDPNLPALVQAIEDGDVTAILTNLAKNPEFLTAAGKAIADIPAVKAFFDGLGIDASQVENLQALMTAIVNDPNLPAITEALAGGRMDEAFALLAQNPAALDAVGDLLADMPVVKKLAEDLGIDLSTLPSLSEALPDLLALKDAVAAGDVSAIAEGLVKVGSLLTSEAFDGMWSKLSAQLPPAVAEFFNGLASSENFADALKALASDPNLPTLTQAIEDGNVTGILTTLAKNPEFLTAAGKALAEIPAVKEFFGKLGIDPAQVENLQALLAAVVNDPNLPAITEALANGEIDEAVALLAQNPDAITALGDIVADLPFVQELAEKLGIDLSQLPDLGEALPDLLALQQAVEAGDVSAIAEGLVKVGSLLTSEAFAGMWSKLAAQLPPEVASFFGDLVSNPDLQSALQALASDPNLPAMVQAIEDGDVAEIVNLLGQNEQFMASASQLLLSIGPVRDYLTNTLGLSEDEIAAIGGAIPDVIAALSAETPEEAIEHLLKAASEITDAGVAQKLLQKITETDAYKNLPQAARDFIGGLLGDPELQAFAQALVDDPNFSSIVSDLAAGEFGSALDQILANPAAVTAGGAALLDIPAVRNFVADKLGIEPEQVKELAGALPELFAALKSKTPQEAVEHLLAAGAAIPAELLNQILGNVGEQIADALNLDQGTRDFLQSVLTDPDLPALLASSGGTLKTALTELLAGNVDSALNTLFSDPALVKFVGEKLLQVPAVQEKIAQLFGLTVDEVAGLAGAGESLLRAYSAATQEPPNLYEASLHAMEALSKVDLATAEKLFDKLADGLGLSGDARATIKNALPTIHGILQDPFARQAVAELLNGNPSGALNTILSHPETAGTLIGAVGEAMGLDPAMVSAIQAALPLLGREEFAVPLKHLLTAIRDGNVDNALTALRDLGSAVSTLAQNRDPLLTDLFNALGLLPGGIGEIFSSPELNAYIVESGTAEGLFSAAQKLANGDLQGAAMDLFAAAGDMLGAGDGAAIEIPGTDVRITEEGARMFAQLFQNLFNALPNGVKNEIKAFITRALGSSFPIFGSLITGVIDAKEFYEAMQNGDNVDKFIAGTQLLLDGAGLVAPGLVTPLKFVMAALQAYRAIDNMTDVVTDAKAIFLGINTDPDEETQTAEEAVVLSYFGGDEEAMQAAMASAPLNELGGDPAKVAAVLQAAEAAGIDPAELPAFVQTLVEAYRGERRGDATLDEVAQLLIGQVEGHAMGGRVDIHQTQARLLRFMRTFMSDDQLRAVGGELPATWEELHDEDAYGIPDALDQLQDQYPFLDRLDKSSVDALVVAAQALGIPPSEFFNFVAGIYARGGEAGVLEVIYAISETNRYHGQGTYYPNNYDIGAFAADVINSLYPGLADQYDGDAPNPGVVAQ